MQPTCGSPVLVSSWRYSTVVNAAVELAEYGTSRESQIPD